MSFITKASADRQKRVLAEILAQPGNNICADCMSPAPRWASWNLGIFICVNCAAGHRKLGTHISKVKSVTLDTWTKEQVESMKSMGNIKANELFNPDPLRNPPPTNMEDSERDSEVEVFIRNKYQYKAFMDRGTVAPKPSRSPLAKASHRPPEIDVSSRILSRSVATPSPSSIRENIEAVSPSASILMAEMQNHTRDQLEGKRGDRARSTPPTDQRGASSSKFTRSVTPNEMQFITAGVAPSLKTSTTSGARPFTANARMGSVPVPTITTTPPVGKSTKPRTSTLSGGFSWARAPSPNASPDPSRSVQPSVNSTTTSQSQAAPTAPQPAPTSSETPKPPEKQLSLYEQDLMALQLGASAPPATQTPTSFPSTNPFPLSNNTGSAYYGQTPSNLLPSPFPFNLAGQTSPFGVNSLTTGSSVQSMPNLTGYNGGMNPGNPFSQMQMQQTGMQSPHNPFGMQQQQQQPQSTFSSSPFAQPQASQTTGAFTNSPFQNNQNPNQGYPFQSSPSPFSMQQTGSSYQQSSPFPQMTMQSPFQQPQQQPSIPPFAQQQQAQATPSLQGANNFSTFANGMLPQQQQQAFQPQPNMSNPFMRQQQTGMGVNGWMAS